MAAVRLGIGWLAACALGCATPASDLEVADTDPTAGAGTSTGPTTYSSTTTTTISSTWPSYAKGPLVSGLDIAKVSAYQPMEIVLMDIDDSIPDLQTPLLTNRGAYVRVFVKQKNKWDPRKVQAVLTLKGLDGGPVHYEEIFKVDENSKDDDMSSTFNFPVDKSELTSATKIVVELFENKADNGGEGGSNGAYWSSKDEGVELDQTAPLDIKLFPVRYYGDGSGRLPDTSDTQIARYEDMMHELYPTTEVRVTLGNNIDWFGEIDASGWGWDSLLEEVSNMRSRANEPANTYYYAVFEPEPTFYEFCTWGCVLGLSYVAYSSRDEWARASIGVGYAGSTSAETLAHEVGHAHGREHAPCGDVSSYDRDYPHNNGEIGAWSMDVARGVLKDPVQNKDIMGYCQPAWMSDYTYFHLYNRIYDLGVARAATEPAAFYKRVTIDGDGRPVGWGEQTMSRGAPGGDEVRVQLTGAGGADLGIVTGYATPHSHLAGGVVLVPENTDVTDLRVLDTETLKRETVLAYPFR
jgi:hypothetical protein